MNINEKRISKIAGIIMLIFGLVIFFFDFKSGYKSFGIYLIPLIFVIVALLVIFKDNISNWFDKQIVIKEFIAKNNKFIFFILPFSIFSIIGFSILFFTIKLKWNVDLLGWITISIFAFFPLLMIYGFVFGFSISEKRQKEIDDRKNKLLSDDTGITIEMPLFDKNCFISWKSIDAIIYYNYLVSSDFTEHYEGYKLYLNTIPIYTKYKKQWWLNTLFPKDSQRKIIDINNETKCFWEIPKIVEKYLNSNVNINFNDPMKGTLISSNTHKNKKSIIKVEKWKQNNNEKDQIVFDKFTRSLEEIKKNYR
jgi:hypothetical protein